MQGRKVGVGMHGVTGEIKRGAASRWCEQPQQNWSQVALHILLVMRNARARSKIRYQHLTQHMRITVSNLLVSMV